MTLRKESQDSGWAFAGVCPETGLNIYRKPEWTTVGFGGNYRITLSIVGDHILLVQPFGYANLHDVTNASRLSYQAATEVFYEGEHYFHVVDLRAYQGSSFGARKHYIGEMLKRRHIAGVIFCNVSSIPRMTINLSKRLSMISTPVHIVNDFPEAVQLAAALMAKEKGMEEKLPVISSHERQISENGFSSVSKSTCPVTSLPITKKPHWTRIRINAKLSVSYHLIGEAILCATLEGNFDKRAIPKLLEEREKILLEAGLVGKAYVEIIDYKSHTGHPSKEARRMTADFLLNEVRKGSLKGVWVINAPRLVRWMFNVGMKLYRTPDFVHMVRNYREAMEQAVALLIEHDIHVGKRQYPRFTKDAWSIQLDDWGTCYELIGDDIIHTVDRGIYRENYIAKSFPLHYRVLEETGLAAKGYYYRIFNFTDLKRVTWKARKMFIDAARESQRRVPCRFSVIYGMNRFMGKIISFTRQFLPVPIAAADSFEAAIAIIEQVRKKEHGTEVSRKPGSPREPLENLYLERYSNELLQFMGHINWDQEGVSLEDISDSHPFKLVFDALSIVKEDVDELFRERKQSEERYRTILETIEDGYFEVDLAGNLTFFNDALGRITGYADSRLMGVNYREYTDEETAERVYRTYAGIYETGEAVKGFEYAINLTGVEKYIETSVSLIRDSKAQPIGFRGILRDVTERKQAEREIRKYSRDLESMVEKRTESLQRSEEKYRTILENIEDGYYELDLLGNLTFFNDAAAGITGYPKEELMGLNYRKFTNEKDSQSQYEEYNRVYQTGVPVKRFESRVLRKDGGERFIETSISLINSPKGRPVGFRGIIRDVSQRKALEHQLMEKSRLAEDANRAKSEFLANLSHEIRTPLNGIIGMAELVLDTRLDPNQKNIFQTINTEANSLLSLINEILDFSKIEAGKVDLEEIPFDLRHTIEDVANSFAYRAQQKGLDFNSFLSPDVPSRLIGDPGRLRQILTNLAGNSLKFTDKGEVYIGGEMAEDLGERIKICFSIKDTGIGIPADKQTTIFDSFRQADGSTTRKYGGTGLGTTISKQLVEMMGGEISFESQEGKGSTFRFTAVLKRQKETQPVYAPMSHDLEGLNVLVVDDNRTNRFIQTEYLKHWGCRPVVAAGGKEALHIIEEAISKKDPFHVILTDFQMPVMNGFELAETIRKMDSLKKVPIIVLTSVGDRGDSRRCTHLGINGYLAKPVRRDELRKAIGMALDISMEEENSLRPMLVTRHSMAEMNRKNLHILLVEDYPTNQVVAMRHLNGAGHQVDLVENGKQALDAFREKHYDLVLMDIQMPVMDGYEATKGIRALESHGMRENSQQPLDNSEKVPIIAMTAHAFEGNRDKCLEVGMNDFLSKPLRREKLLAMVEKWAGGIDDGSLKVGDRIKGDDALKGPSPENPQAHMLHIKDQNGDPMDFKKAVEEFEGDEAFLVEVLRGFIEKVNFQIKAIHQAITEGNADMVREEAHSIKGGAGNLTAVDLSHIAAELEKAAKSGALETGVQLVEKLEEAFRRLDACVSNKYGKQRIHGKPS